jgi:hypothetical protein
MFQAPSWSGRRMTFRLQLFTGPYLKPVAIATQVRGEGLSLVNGAEAVASAVWEQLTPHDPEPPLLVIVLLDDQYHDVRTAHRSLDRPLFLSFSTADAYAVTGPDWLPLHPSKVDALVGVHVDLGRGHDYQPTVREVGPQLVQKMAVQKLAGMPPANPFREDCLAQSAQRLRAAPTRHRLRLHPWARTPHPAPPPCTCWYHEGDWRVVSATAITLLEQEHQRGTGEDDLVNHVLREARALALTTWQKDALASLFLAPLDADNDGWVNGQHRYQAMVDAGVQATVVHRTYDI